MGARQWFLIEMVNGRPEIVSEMFDSLEEAKKVWNWGKNSVFTICETVYG